MVKPRNFGPKNTNTIYCRILVSRFLTLTIRKSCLKQIRLVGPLTFVFPGFEWLRLHCTMSSHLWQADGRRTRRADPYRNYRKARTLGPECVRTWKNRRNRANCKLGKSAILNLILKFISFFWNGGVTALLPNNSSGFSHCHGTF